MFMQGHSRWRIHSQWAGNPTLRERNPNRNSILTRKTLGPRTIEFEALADRLEMSKSALSQRLRAAESKLRIDLLEE